VTLLEITTGSEKLTSFKLASRAWYTNHAKCPINLNNNSCTLSVLAKSKLIGLNGDTVTAIRQDSNFFIDENNQKYAQKLKLFGWFRGVYDCPDSLILKLDLNEEALEFGKMTHRGILFIKIRSTGPEWLLRFKKGHAHPLIARGRFDILTPDQILTNNLISHPLESKFIDLAYIQQFVQMDITKPA